LRHVVLDYVTLLLNRELISTAKLCLVSIFPDIVKDCPKMRNLPKIFLSSFENVGTGANYAYTPCGPGAMWQWYSGSLYSLAEIVAQPTRKPSCRWQTGATRCNV